MSEDLEEEFGFISDSAVLVNQPDGSCNPFDDTTCTPMGPAEETTAVEVTAEMTDSGSRAVFLPSNTAMVILTMALLGRLL